MKNANKLQNAIIALVPKDNDNARHLFTAMLEVLPNFDQHAANVSENKQGSSKEFFNIYFKDKSVFSLWNNSGRFMVTTADLDDQDEFCAFSAIALSYRDPVFVESLQTVFEKIAKMLREKEETSK